MGGVFTSVARPRSLGGRLPRCVPAARRSGRGHPLARATRREMQQVHRSIEPELTWTSADAAPALGQRRLRVRPVHRRTTCGSGGSSVTAAAIPGSARTCAGIRRPGSASSRVGNARYAPMFCPVMEALAAAGHARRRRDPPGRARGRRRPRPAPPSSGCSTAGTMREADGLFAMNVDLDEPLARRRARDRAAPRGPRRAPTRCLTAEPSAHARRTSPGGCAASAAGSGSRSCSTPSIPPRVQALTLTSVPDPPPALAAIARRLAGCSGAGPGLAAGPATRGRSTVDAIGRALRAAEARFGPVTVGDPIASDGATSATWRLTGERGDLDLEPRARSGERGADRGRLRAAARWSRRSRRSEPPG